uniref:Uncharacterized protein n=1 Tax=Knipowitschia caucasica TaxID=637954 RepID=A0AAV2LPZ5_KNICA
MMAVSNTFFTPRPLSAIFRLLGESNFRFRETSFGLCREHPGTVTFIGIFLPKSLQRYIFNFQDNLPFM